MSRKNFQFSIFNFQLQKGQLQAIRHLKGGRMDSFQVEQFVQSGQALITLLFFMIIAVTITSAAVVVILTNSLSAQKLELGTISFYAAESGAENALLRLLRNPSYTGETLAIDGATVISTVSQSGSDYTVNSEATSGNSKRKVEITASFVNNILTISSWKEVF